MKFLLVGQKTTLSKQMLSSKLCQPSILKWLLNDWRVSFVKKIVLNARETNFSFYWFFPFLIEISFSQFAKVSISNFFHFNFKFFPNFYTVLYLQAYVNLSYNNDKLILFHTFCSNRDCRIEVAIGGKG